MESLTSTLFLLLIYCVPFILIGGILWVIYEWVKHFIFLKQEHLKLLKEQNMLLKELIDKTT